MRIRPRVQVLRGALVRLMHLPLTAASLPSQSLHLIKALQEGLQAGNGQAENSACATRTDREGVVSLGGVVARNMISSIQDEDKRDAISGLALNTYGLLTFCLGFGWQRQMGRAQHQKQRQLQWHERMP